jgi:cobalt-zinc-cadmium efflux system protein
VPGVLGVHDVHAWSISSERYTASLHVLVAQQSVSCSQRILKAFAEKLRHDFGIGHATIQIEVDGCEADETSCTMRPLAEGHDGHSH